MTPTTPPALIAFAADNWEWLSPLLKFLTAGLLLSILNGLKRYGDRTMPLQGALHAVIDRLSVTTARDSPGTLKLPIVMKSRPPNSPERMQLPDDSDTPIGGSAALILVFTVAAVVALLGCGCASALDRARQTVASAFAAERVASEMLVSIDKEKQEAIIATLEKTGDVEGAKRDRDTWRAERAKAVQALRVVHVTIVSAAVTTELAASGKEVDLSRVVQNVAKALAALRDALKTFDITLTPGGFPLSAPPAAQREFLIEAQSGIEQMLEHSGIEQMLECLMEQLDDATLDKILTFADAPIRSQFHQFDAYMRQVRTACILPALGGGR